MESKQIIEKLKTFTTSELCDGFGNGRYRTMDYHIKRQVTNKNIVGRAYPVDTPYGISGIIPNAILNAKEGDVIVVAGKGFCKGSFWGDHRSICAAKKGLAGVVIDGAFRDKEGCEEAGVPIFARCVVPGSAGKCQQTFKQCFLHKINNDTSDTSNASDNASDHLIFCDMVDQKTDQSKYNDPDDQITDRTGRKILQQIVQQIKEKQCCTSSDRCDHRTFCQR